MLESRLLQGCCDIHLHVAPSLIPRSADIVTVARQAEAAGYRAIVIKDHHYNSAPACDQIQRYLFNGSPLRIFVSRSTMILRSNLTAVSIKYTLWMKQKK